MNMEALQKTKRVRKKRLFSLILHQMEFYFSNASLTRDRYLQSFLDKDKFVPISVFLTFNKIKELTEDKGDVKRALENSHFLQLSSDGDGVGRRSPFVLKEDAERCTIYVENIPRSCGARALTRTFSAFGTIDYISIPANRATGQHRGFGFVAFRTPNMAHNALQAFGALGRRMPSEHYPEYLASPGDHPPAAAVSDPETDEFADDFRVEHLLPPMVPGSAQEADSRPGKRKLSTDSNSRDAPLKVTRFAETPESSEVAASSQPTNSLPTAGSATPAYTDNSNLSELRLDGASRATSLQTERTDDTDVSAEGQTPRRRRRTRRGQKQCVAETEDTSLLGIQIMPLSEWSRCRERYRSLQKENMSAIKALLRSEPTDNPSAPQRASSGPPQFVPASVVRFAPERSDADAAQLIAQLKQQYGALYVELPPAPAAAYMRFSTGKAASEAVSSGLDGAAVLQGEEEEQYWRRLAEERELSRGQRRRSKERGRDRLLRRLKAGSEDAEGAAASC